MTSLQVTDDMLWKDAPAGLKSFRQEGEREKRKRKENVQLKRSLSRLLIITCTMLRRYLLAEPGLGYASAPPGGVFCPAAPPGGGFCPAAPTMVPSTP